MSSLALLSMQMAHSAHAAASTALLKGILADYSVCGKRPRPGAMRRFILFNDRIRENLLRAKVRSV